MERIIAACDGASKGNPGPAAWAWVIAGADGDAERWAAGPLGRATNNVAELTALERLLEVLDPAVPAQVRMDSQYAMKAVTTWLPGWRRKGWKTSAGTPVANRDLVVRIDELLAGREVEFVHTPAHRADGDRLNDAADRAASHSAHPAADRLRVGGRPAPARTRHRPSRRTPPPGGGEAGAEGRGAGPLLRETAQGTLPGPVPLWPAVREGRDDREEPRWLGPPLLRRHRIGRGVTPRER